MDTLEIRKKLHQNIDSSEDGIINAVFALFKTCNNSPKMNKRAILAYNNEIDEAMKEIDNGDFVTHSEVESMIKKRYEKANMV